MIYKLKVKRWPDDSLSIIEKEETIYQVKRLFCESCHWPIKKAESFGIIQTQEHFCSECTYEFENEVSEVWEHGFRN